MTTATSTFTRNRAAVARPFKRIGEGATALWRTLKYRHHQRRSVEHLRTMTDHQLRDLGIRRAEITAVVYGREAGKVKYHEV